MERWQIGIALAIIVVTLIYVTLAVSNSWYWTEWVPANPSCGSGVQTRQCTANSLWQGLVCMGSAQQSYSLGACPVNGQYVRLSAPPNSMSALNIVDINVLDKAGNSLIKSGVTTATASSTLNSDALHFGPGNLIMGHSSSTGSNGYQLGHTNPNIDHAQWLEVNLGSVQEIGQVVITNRNDCCSDRIVNSAIEIFDGNHASILKLPIITTNQPKYTLPVANA